MTVESTFVFESTKRYFDKFAVAVAKNQTPGSFMSRSTLDEHNVYDINQNHPTLNNVQKTIGIHVITSGSVINTWSWEEPIPQEDFIAFKNYIEESNQGGTYDFTLEPNKFSVHYKKDSVITPWKEWQFKYGLKSESSRMEAGPEGFSFFCLTHVDGKIESWTREHGDISPNSSFELIKPDSEECYILFSEDVLNENGILKAYQVYKLTSSTTNIQNTSQENCKMLRIYK